VAVRLLRLQAPHHSFWIADVREQLVESIKDVVSRESSVGVSRLVSDNLHHPSFEIDGQLVISLFQAFWD